VLGRASEHDKWTSEDASDDDKDDEKAVGRTTGATDMLNLAVASWDLECACEM
jgi:hypothetical protein